MKTSGAFDTAKRILAHLRRHRAFSAFQIPPNRDVIVGTYRIGPTGSIKILSIPSVFPPEQWGRVFLTGLLRRGAAFFKGKRLIELGAGTGWISIALAKFAKVKQIITVDINPQAKVVTQINAILNGVGERIHPLESDLFEKLNGRPLKVDHIIGNIPQVVSKDLRKVCGDKALRALADYAEPRGTAEDLFSLGLVAAALKQSLPYLKEGGSILLNLAGRPGYDVLRWLFARWGFVPRIIHRERVQQDAMTSLEPLVRAEQETGRRFHFYDMLTASHPISATEAYRRTQGGDPVWHDLYVVEGRAYRDVLVRSARRAFKGLKRIGYTERPGFELEELRLEITRYLRAYFKLDVLPDEVFIAPSMKALQRLIRGTGHSYVVDATQAPVLSRVMKTQDPIGTTLEQKRDDVIVTIDLGRQLNLPGVQLSVGISRRFFPTLEALADSSYARAPLLEQIALKEFLRALNKNYRGTWDASPRKTKPHPPHEIESDPGVAPGLHRAGDDYIRLDFGESEWPAPSAAIRGARRAGTIRDVQKAAATYLAQTRGVKFSPDEIVVGPGVQTLIETTLRALKLPVLLPVPYFGIFPPMIQSTGLRTVPVLTRRVSDELAIELPDTRGALLVSQPNNPTGLYYSESAVRQIEKSGNAVLVDEVFGMLGDGYRRIQGDVLYAGMSKEFALGGLRVGWAASRDASLRRAIRRELTHEPDPWSLGAAAAVLEEGKKLLRRHRDRFVLPRRSMLERALKELGIPYIPAAGGLFMWVDFDAVWLGRTWNGTNTKGKRVGRPARITRENFREILYAATFLTVNSPEWAGVPQGPYRVVYAVERLPEAVDRLRVFALGIRR
jgi:aspartate/methionine/tyrosine aminotransferase/methylase of polypeptide subunit release factors